MIGDRVRQARLAAGLTLEQVSARMGALNQPITKAGLSKYERNASTPSPAFLLNLARVLGVTGQYFIREPAVRIGWVAFRKHPQLSENRQEQIKAYAAQIAEGQLWLEQTIYPGARPLMPAKRPVRTPEGAEDAAMELRALWKLGEAPIESVTGAAEAHGTIVVGWRQDEGKVDGLSGWVNETIPLALVNTSTAPERRRYTLAHELGHMVMQPAAEYAADGELLAQRFAAAFLVPAATARRELGVRRHHLSFDELALLKRKHGLSMSGWAHRAYDTGIIDEGHRNALCRAFVRNGWKKQEPTMFHGREEPTRLEQLVLHAVSEGIVTDTQAKQLCPWYSARSVQEEHTDERGMAAKETIHQSAEDRSRVLVAAVVGAEQLYRDNSDLVGFDAAGEGDLCDYPDAG